MDGFAQQYIPATLDGLNVLDADQLYIGGEEVKLDNYVPYTLANKTVDLNSQNIKTTHYAAASSDLVNLQVLTDAIQYVDTANALTYVNKVTGSTQTMNAELHGPNFTASGRLTVWDTGSKYYNARVEVSGEDFVIQRDDSISPIVDILKYDLSANKWIFTEGVASKVPIWDADKGLVSSGVDSIKITYLDNVSSDIQTQLNNRLQLSGGTMTGNIVMGANKITSAYNPVNAEDMTRKGYVDTAISSATAGKANLAGGNIFTGTQTYTDQTASTVAIFNASKALVSSSVSTTTLGYLDATSSIQTQLDNKLNDTGDTATGIIAVDIANAYSSRASNPLPSNFVAKSSSGRLYMGSYYTGGVGVCATIQSSDFYSGLDHGADLLLNPLGGNVVVGGDATLARFQVNNAGATDFLTFQNTNYTFNDYINQRFMFGTSSGTNRSAYIQAALTSSNETDLLFYVAPSGGSVTERFRIKGNSDSLFNGKVGIGTDAPSAPLHIKASGGGNPAANGLYVYNPTNTAGQDAIVSVRVAGTSGGNPYVSFDVSGETGWAWGMDNSDNSMKLASSWDSLATNPRLRIQNNGDTIFANYIPYQNANFIVSRSGTSTSFAVVAGNENDNAILYLGTPHVPTDSANSAYKCAIIADGNGTGVGWSTSNLHFCLNGTTGNNDVSQNANLTHSRMVIKGTTGDVGIGTTQPNHTLDVQRDVRTGAHPSGYALYVTRLTTTEAMPIAAFRHSNGTQGINIGYNTISASGENANQPLQLAARGNESINFLNRTTVSSGDSSITLYGPNATWGAYLRCGAGGNGASANTAQVLSTNGNLHLDGGYGKDIYIGYYPWAAGGGNRNNIYSYSRDFWEHQGTMVIYSPSNDYTNSLVVRTNWSSITLNNSEFGGRNWSILSGGPGAGVGQGGFGIFDITGGAYRLGISTGGTVTVYTDLIIPGISTVETPNGQTNNRLLFRDAGTGLVRTGACSTWNITYTTVAWTYGLWIDYLVYIPNTTCTIQIDITGSGYSAGIVTQTVFEIFLYPMFVGTPYVQYGIPFFFNQTYSHTQVTLHATIPNNAWGASTVGWKRMYAQWIYAAGGAIASDANDTLNMNIRVIG